MLLLSKLYYFTTTTTLSTSMDHESPEVEGHFKWRLLCVHVECTSRTSVSQNSLSFTAAAFIDKTPPPTGNNKKKSNICWCFADVLLGYFSDGLAEEKMEIHLMMRRGRMMMMKTIKTVTWFGRRVRLQMAPPAVLQWIRITLWPAGITMSFNCNHKTPWRPSRFCWHHQVLFLTEIERGPLKCKRSKKLVTKHTEIHHTKFELQS